MASSARGRHGTPSAQSLADAAGGDDSAAASHSGMPTSYASATTTSVAYGPGGRSRSVQTQVINGMQVTTVAETDEYGRQQVTSTSKPVTGGNGQWGQP